jgi:hypothetical protein
MPVKHRSGPPGRARGARGGVRRGGEGSGQAGGRGGSAGAGGLAAVCAHGRSDQTPSRTWAEKNKNKTPAQFFSRKNTEPGIPCGFPYLGGAGLVTTMYRPSVPKDIRANALDPSRTQNPGLKSPQRWPLTLTHTQKNVVGLSAHGVKAVPLFEPKICDGLLNPFAPGTFLGGAWW